MKLACDILANVAAPNPGALRMMNLPHRNIGRAKAIDATHADARPSSSARASSDGWPRTAGEIRAFALGASIALLGLLSVVQAQAQEAGESYAGKQVRLVVGSTTGNDNDVWARLLARHLSRHLPGAPPVIVENMPGAGGVIAANYLFNVAPSDGSVIGMISRSMPAAALTKVANVRFDPSKFHWLGSPEISNLVMYVNSSTQMTQASELFDRQIVVGATGIGQGITVGPMLLKNVLGMKLKIVTGYRAPGDLALAAARGEIEGFANTTSAVGTKREWVESGQMRVLFNFEPDPVPGLGAPSVFPLIKTDEQRSVMRFFASNGLLGRPLVAPPGVAPGRVALLRRAFESVMRDPDLLKEAETMALDANLQTGEKISALVADVGATSPRIVEIAEAATRGE